MKRAVNGLAQNIRAQCVGTGVRVTLVQPGLVDTGGIPPERAHDLKRQPGDVARAALCAVTQPATVDVNEILIRPVGQGRCSGGPRRAGDDQIEVLPGQGLPAARMTRR